MSPKKTTLVINKSIDLNGFSPNSLLFFISLKEIAGDEEAYKRSLKVMESRAHQERRDNEDFARNENHRREISQYADAHKKKNGEI